jgi:mannosyl-oligosaccharide alpha-1,2-mannosidase
MHVHKTIESFFYLWKFTGQDIWRHRGWAVFEAIEKNTKTEYGYASIRNVNMSSAPKKDTMPRCVHGYMLLVFANFVC